MATITLQGSEIHTSGDLPPIGEKAPDFQLVNKELKRVNLSEFSGKKKIISIVPSLDTPVCATSSKKLDEYVAERNDVVVLIVSSDLPFAMSRFCTSSSLENIVPLSLMNNQQFAKDYGVLIEDGPLAGITARALVVLNTDNEIIHTELVGEIAEEPNYEAAIAALG
jgi:thiol peroxidase